jgi:4-amino-4-deoxy-L-arabinose transferase-like glycosyltransferase
MTSFSPASQSSRAMPSFALAVAILAVLTAVRLIALRYSVVDLFFDESQYWTWSREFAFGYFSKPPLLAWVIGIADSVCGSSEACVRAASPVLHFGLYLLVYAIANDVYDERTAFWSALTMALTTGAVFSARIISTDVPLLFFWALALLAYVKLLRGPDWRWAIVLGVAFGFGMLAKYAMAYFFLGAALAAVFDRDARAVALRPQTWAALVIALLVLAPNVAWNAANGFVTLKHTGQNIHGGGLQLMPIKALEFVASQFAVFGPIVFGALLVVFARFKSPSLTRADRLMVAFAVPPLVLVTALAFVRSAHGNWAAPAIVSGVIVVTAVWVRQEMWRWLKASLIIGVVVQAVLIVGDALADRLSIPALGRKADLYERTLGWRALGEASARLARETGAPTVAAEQRADIASLNYYLRGEKRAVLAWPVGSTPDNHFDLASAVTATTAEPVLFVTPCPRPERLARQYRNVTPLGPFDARKGPTSARRYHAFLLSGNRGPIEPLGRCE